MSGAQVNAAPDYAEIEQALQEHGLVLRGGFHVTAEHAARGHAAMPDGRTAWTILLAGVTGRSLWQTLMEDAQFETDRAAGVSNALDAWSERTLRTIADQFGAAAVFPNDQPYRPFQVWAQAAEPVFPSPIGMLIHPEFGLWHAYRGALLFEEKLELPPRADATRPCDACADKPCLTACPVGAFSPNADGSSTYDVRSCADHLRTDAGQACLNGGCQARNACPVGAEHRYGADQMRFQMAAFARARGVAV
jgi:ferredoxin